MTAAAAVSALARATRSYARILRPPPAYRVSEWAQRYRWVSAPAAVQGHWRNERTPHAVEPMDRLSSHDPCDTVVLMFCAQAVKSEIMNNWLAYTIHHDPCSFVLAQPADQEARDYARERIEPMIADTAVLRGLVTDRNVRLANGSSTMRKFFPGGWAAIIGASSPKDTAGRPVGRFAGDEIDRWPADVGGEGDPVALFWRRQSSYQDAKRLLIGTPTRRDGSRIESEFLLGDRRYLFVPCPHCGHYQRLLWGAADTPFGLKWPERDPAAAFYVCAHCGCAIEEREKPRMLARARWHPTIEPCPTCREVMTLDFDRATWTADGDVTHAVHTCPHCPADAPTTWVPTGKPVAPLRYSYHLHGLYRPWGWKRGWGVMASEWVAANAAHDQAALKTIVNTDFGETWEEKGGIRVEADGLLDRSEDFGPDSSGAVGYDSVPDGVIVLTAGVDVHPDRLECQLTGWGAGEESWCVDYRVFPGDTGEGCDTWAALDEFMLGQWRTVSGCALTVSAGCVDAGYNADVVYRWTKARRARRLWAIRGVENTPKVPDRPVWPKRPKRPARGAYERYDVGVDTAKTVVLSRLTRTSPGGGHMHFGRHCDAVYFRQLTVERQVTEYLRNGGRFQRWTKPEGARNEVLDCTVYAFGAMRSLIASGIVKLPAPGERSTVGARPGGTQRQAPDVPTATPAPSRRLAPARRSPRKGSVWSGQTAW